VLGPEKLPRVVSEFGRWVGRARAMARQFREQLEEEVQLVEARKAQRPSSAPPAAAAAAPPPVPSSVTDAAGADSSAPRAPSADERAT
jgi:sec-independent protein translocase protein TatB